MPKSSSEFTSILVKNRPTIEIFTCSENAPDQPRLLNRPGFAHLAFEVDDVDAKRVQIKKVGGDDYGELVTIDIAGACQLTLLYMTDPEGNIVELQKIMWSMQ